MSALWGLAVGGVIPVGSGPTVAWRNGAPFNALGELVVGAAPITHWSNGLPFNATGEVVISTVGTVTGYCGGVPMRTDGVAAAVDAGVNWSNYVPYDVAGHVQFL